MKRVSVNASELKELRNIKRKWKELINGAHIVGGEYIIVCGGCWNVSMGDYWETENCNGNCERCGNGTCGTGDCGITLADEANESDTDEYNGPVVMYCNKCQNNRKESHKKSKVIPY